MRHLPKLGESATRREMEWGRILVVVWIIWLLCNEWVFEGRADKAFVLCSLKFPVLGFVH